MKKSIILMCLVYVGILNVLSAQNKDKYVEFNDRNNVVHGVYIGIMARYGQIDESDTFIGSVKIAYVANRQFEVGFGGVGFYTDRYSESTALPSIDIFGGYGGLHLEPILFGRSKVNLSFPVLIGGGGLGYDGDQSWHSGGKAYNNWDFMFVVEPGASILYNISRYLQVEAGVKYRFSSRIDLNPYPLSRIDGFSAGIGIKVGVFNLGRNRYKKNL